MQGGLGVSSVDAGVRMVLGNDGGNDLLCFPGEKEEDNRDDLFGRPLAMQILSRGLNSLQKREGRKKTIWKLV